MLFLMVFLNLKIFHNLNEIIFWKKKFFTVVGQIMKAMIKSTFNFSKSGKG